MRRAWLLLLLASFGVAAQDPGTVKEDFKDGQKYVWVPPGTFTMGCSPGDKCFEEETPAHAVIITKGFWLGQTEVTVGAWKRYTKARGVNMPPEPKLGDRALNPGWSEDRQPIVNVRYEDATSFCEWAGGTLPSEAEWEYAARAGTVTARYGNVDDIAWYGDNSGRAHLDSAELLAKDSRNYAKHLEMNGNAPKPVGTKQPNAWNLYDMLGSVWEWVADWYEETYKQLDQRRDPTGPANGLEKVLRGGSWYSHAGVTKAGNRLPANPEVRSNVAGLRCVLAE